MRHFTAVADAVDRPLIVYNVPSRTGVSCTAETYAVLAQHPNIVGVKEASGSFALIQETLNLCGDGFSVWSGNDEDTAAVCALGGAGVISVAANIVPREITGWWSCALPTAFWRQDANSFALLRSSGRSSARSIPFRSRPRWRAWDCAAIFSVCRCAK